MRHPGPGPVAVAVGVAPATATGAASVPAGVLSRWQKESKLARTRRRARGVARTAHLTPKQGSSGCRNFPVEARYSRPIRGAGSMEPLRAGTSRSRCGVVWTRCGLRADGARACATRGQVSQSAMREPRTRAYVCGIRVSLPATSTRVNRTRPRASATRSACCRTRSRDGCTRRRVDSTRSRASWIRWRVISTRWRVGLEGKREWRACDRVRVTRDRVVS